MTGFHLVLRNLAHWRFANAAIILGAAVGTAALAGALIVGDSLRGSLRDSALARIGPFDEAVTVVRPVRTQLARDWQADTGERVVPCLIVAASASSAESGSRANQVQLFGLERTPGALDAPSDADRPITLNAPLAESIGVAVGDEVVLQLAPLSAISRETLLGHQQQPAIVARFTVTGIRPASGIGGLSLAPRTTPPLNAFVPLAALQRLLKTGDRVNTLLIAGPASGGAPTPLLTLKRHWCAADLGLRLRRDDARGYVSLESDSMLLEPEIERAAETATKRIGAKCGRVLAYLVNEIAAAERHASGAIPYSVVAAMDGEDAAARAELDALGVEAPRPGEIVLNEWTARQLDARLGDSVNLSYFVTAADGALRESQSSFRLSGIAPPDGPAADPGFVPEYPGVTDTARISDWDPPFPIDLKRISQRDEDYWREHRTTPKAFIALADGLRLWSEHGARFGRITSMRWPATIDSAALEAALLAELSPAAVGIRHVPLRAQAESAASGPTDFGGLFIGLSLFVIASGAMLVALLFRLNFERRGRELGLLLAVGYSPRRVARRMLGEGAVLATIGTALGLLGAIGYAHLMLSGLSGAWSPAAGATELTLHVRGASGAIGMLCGVGLALAATTAAIRGLSKRSPRDLLAGGASTAAPPQRRSSTLLTGLLAFALAVAAGVLASVEAIPLAVGFFLSGAACVAAGLSSVRLVLIRRPTRIRRDTSPLDARRNASRQLGRSMLTVSLLATASFLIASLAAFQTEPPDTDDRFSGTGGFSLWAEATTPLHCDLRDPADPDFPDVSVETRDLVLHSHPIGFRLRPGDAASCTNPYARNAPRVLGATPAMIARGGFAFAATRGPAAGNPWTLLDSALPDGVIPAIADEAAVLWQLKSGLGKDYAIETERGDVRRLRFVALLVGSTLQDEIILSEQNFTALFPSRTGYSFFLFETPAQETDAIARVLERELGVAGLDVGRTRDRLRGYLAVQNTYLSIFQTLGGMGLVLGVLGLAAVMLRNVFERRREIALLRAVGYTNGRICALLLSENVWLVGAGMFVGLISAAVAVAPALLERPAQVPWGLLGGMVIAVLTIGGASGWFAARAALREPIVATLRSE